MIARTSTLAPRLDLRGTVGTGVGGHAYGRRDDLVLLPDEFDDVGGVAGDDAGAGALHQFRQLGVDSELVLCHGPDHVDVVLASQVVHLADARIVCKSYSRMID